MCVFMAQKTLLLCRFTASQSKSKRAFFKVEIEKLILKFMWNCKGPRIASEMLKRKNKVKGLSIRLTLKL